MLKARREPEDTPVVFIHIPKAGGQSLRSLLEANYAAEARLPIYRGRPRPMAEVFAERSPEKLARKRIVYGHIPHAIEQHIGRPCRYFTVLREPISRSISAYKFLKYDFPVAERRAAMARVSFGQFCRRPGRQGNIMTRLLSGHEPGADADTGMLATALGNLRAMPVFGLFEAYEQSIVRICATFGWENKLEVRNRSSKTNEEFLASEGATAEDLEHLRANNALDIELYAAARRLYTAAPWRRQLLRWLPPGRARGRIV